MRSSAKYEVAYQLPRSAPQRVSSGSTAGESWSRFAQQAPPSLAAIHSPGLPNAAPKIGQVHERNQERKLRRMFTALRSSTGCSTAPLSSNYCVTVQIREILVFPESWWPLILTEEIHIPTAYSPLPSLDPHRDQVMLNLTLLSPSVEPLFDITCISCIAAPLFRAYPKLALAVSSLLATASRSIL